MDQQLSFEFFPPKTDEGVAKLRTTIGELAKLHPAFFSVTFGAGGSTQDGTLRTVLDIKRAGFNAAPHLSCVGATAEGIRALLRQYREGGIAHIVALRGDMPSGMAVSGEFRYASDLVSFIRAETGAHFHIEVAAYPEYHPQARTAQENLQHFKIKVDAGANSAITQYFYNADAYFHFVEQINAMGISIPVVPGIMPITNYAQLARFSDACGAEIPRWIRGKLAGYGDDTASIRAFGLDVVSKLCETLLEGGAPGIHFYTLNQSDACTKIWQHLGLHRD